MRMIKKSNVATASVEGGELDPTIVTSLKRCYVTRDARYDDITKVQGLLRQARESDSWLECDCKPPLSAFLFPRKLPTDAYTLARPPHSSQYAHTEECAFHHADFSVSMSSNHPILNVYSPDKPQATLNHEMLDILHWLLNEKGLFDYPTAQTYHYVDALNKTADYLNTLSPLFDDVTPAKVINTFGKHVVPFYKRLSKLHFPQGYYPHGFIFGMASSTSPDSVELVSGAQVQMQHPIYEPTGSSGPLWCLLLVVQQSKDYFISHSGVAVPAYSIKQPYVLSNSSERDVFKQLLSVCISLSDASSPTIEKRHGTRKVFDGFLVHNAERVVTVTDSKTLHADKNEPNSLNYADFGEDRTFRQHLYARLK